MFSFRQKIFVGYLSVFLVFIVLLFPFVTRWVKKIVLQSMEARTTEIITNIKHAPNNDALVRRLKDQKSLMFFRSSIITHEHKVLYDSHTKRLLGPKFTQDYIVSHPEVLQAFHEGVGYSEDHSQILNQKFAYFAKAFDFHGKTYVLRTAFPYQYVREIIHDFEIGFLGFATLILLLFSFMTWFVIHYLTQPIQRIINAVKPYREGTQYILPAIELGGGNANDDFNKLAYTLNSLSLKIQNHIDTITKERNEKETILESLVEGVIATDNDMNITYTNHMAMKLMNYFNDLISKNFSVLQQERCEILLHRCQEEKKPLNDTLEIYREGKKIYLDVVAAPMKDNAGAILVLQDKTAHHKILEMRRDFITNASHELKTPITIIRGFAEALHDNPDLSVEMRNEVTGKIVRNCNRMAALIKDLLTLADIENIPSSRLSLFNLHELIEACCTMLLEVFPDTKIIIDKQKEGEILLFADIDLLELAIMNLIENATKYSTRPAQICITLSEKEDEIIIKVTDKGIGIPLIDQEHIFDRFYTVDKAHSQKMGGSGLGLSIVKTIVEKHFGKITLESELGKGSTFTIHLPKRSVEDI